MDAAEKADILARLETGRAAFLESVAGLSEADAARPPAPGRWSVLECAEHVAVTEEALYHLLRAGRPSETVIPPEREAKIRERAADRSRPVPAPEVAHPHGRYATVAEAVAAFLAAREKTLAYVAACDEDLRAKHTTHPILKMATCHETLLMIAAHPERHAKQIAEIRGPRPC
jgi:hypothetical protein